VIRTCGREKVYLSAGRTHRRHAALTRSRPLLAEIDITPQGRATALSVLLSTGNREGEKSLRSSPTAEARLRDRLSPAGSHQVDAVPT
ncbi:hypothetical protein AB0454_44360, partial [Streptomyces sp. NPDC093509]|uniref:hypothetical protein n=1 Tax=Streptomyces sp. NPDC093509 TaxID=3154982 RepID=UPI00344FAB43